MENIKKITIKDFDKELHFRIKLFGAMEGIDFIDKLVGEIKAEKISIKPYLSDLLPLATLLDANGVNEVQKMDLNSAGVMFKNPLSVLDLALQILEFQELFLENSGSFKHLIPTLKQKFSIKTTELAI